MKRSEHSEPLPPRVPITRPEQEPIAPLRAEEEEPVEVAQKRSTSALGYLVGKVSMAGGQPGAYTKITKPRRQVSPAPDRFPSRPPGPSRTSR
jgi:hypothetical protein